MNKLHRSYKKLGLYIKEYSHKNKNNENIPVYSVTNSQGFCKEFFNKEVASQDKSTYKIVPRGYFAYNPSRINVGSISWQSSEERVIVSPLYNIFKVSEELDNDYLLYYLKSPSSIAYIDAISRGTVRSNLKLSALKEFNIPYYSLDEQKNIVKELDCLNESIVLLKQQLKDLDALAHSIYIDMFGDSSNTPKGFIIKTIGEICTLKSGNSDANNSKPGDLPYVKVADMNVTGNETFITTSSNFVSRQDNIKGIFPIGTIIFPKRGGAILTNKKRLTKVEICCDLNIMGVIPDLKIVHPIFIYYYFLNLDFHIFANTGSTIPQINNHNIAPLKIGIPPLDLQNIFALKIAAIEESKSSLNTQILEMETLLASRIQYWFE